MALLLLPTEVLTLVLYEVRRVSAPRQPLYQYALMGSCSKIRSIILTASLGFWDAIFLAKPRGYYFDSLHLLDHTLRSEDRRLSVTVLDGANRGFLELLTAHGPRFVKIDLHGERAELHTAFIEFQKHFPNVQDLALNMEYDGPAELLQLDQLAAFSQLTSATLQGLCLSPDGVAALVTNSPALSSLTLFFSITHNDVWTNTPIVDVAAPALTHLKLSDEHHKLAAIFLHISWPSLQKLELQLANVEYPDDLAPFYATLRKLPTSQLSISLDSETIDLAVLPVVVFEGDVWKLAVTMWEDSNNRDCAQMAAAFIRNFPPLDLHITNIAVELSQISAD